MHSAKTIVSQKLESADVKINGTRPWDVQVHDENVYKLIIQKHSLGLGQAYVAGLWDCDQLDQFFTKILSENIDTQFRISGKMLCSIVINKMINLQTISRSLDVANQHYNLNNSLYQLMLGPSMAYTCGYYKNTDQLDQAQYDKYDLICRKLDIQENDHVLELGCGFGGFAHYAALHYGCRITAVNISTEQLAYAREHNTQGLPIEFIEADYRNHPLYNPNKQLYDKVVSIGLCEHIGRKNYNQFLHIAVQQLKHDGLFLLHTIGNNTSLRQADPWIEKYIFPNGYIPSIQQIGNAMENHFIMEDWHNFGCYYDHTLMDWERNFSQHRDKIADQYDDQFYRMWRYYLLSCAGAFRARTMQLWQIVMSKPYGYKQGYEKASYAEQNKQSKNITTESTQL